MDILLKVKFCNNYAQINDDEQDEPSFDEYVYCDDCGSFVHDYCTEHGPLRVIPDDEVPAEGNYPPAVPRAILTLPLTYLKLARSGAGLGVYTKVSLPSGIRFGPYSGVLCQTVESDYCWTILDRNRNPAHVVDAADPAQSNWLRYVNCARDWREQNLVAFQYRGQVYYRTIETIPPFTELRAYYGIEYAHALQIEITHFIEDQYSDDDSE